MIGLWFGGYGDDDANPLDGFFNTAWQANQLGDKIIPRKWNDATRSELIGIDYAVVYSYGCAELWHLLYGFDPNFLPTIQKLIMLVPVPRFWWGQTYMGKLWTVPPNVKSATCYQIDSFPVSLPISNPGPNYVNVNLNWKGLDHVSIQYDNYTRGLILSELEILRKNLTPSET